MASTSGISFIFCTIWTKYFLSDLATTDNFHFSSCICFKKYSCQMCNNLINSLFFFGWAISRCLSTTPHPIGGQGGSILLVHCFMIIPKPAILIIMAIVRYNHTPIYRLPCRFRIFVCYLSTKNCVYMAETAQPYTEIF